MSGNSDLARQLLETVQQRLENKVLERLRGAEGGGAGIAALIDMVYAEEAAELEARAADADAAGQQVEAEMYRLMGTDLLPQAAETLRNRLRSG